MSLIYGNKTCSIEEVAAVVTPDSTGRHTPIPHTTLIDETKKLLRLLVSRLSKKLTSSTVVASATLAGSPSLAPTSLARIVKSFAVSAILTTRLLPLAFASGTV